MIRLGRPIVHFEIPVTDSERMSRFYSDLFDWKFGKQDMPGMDYWMIETTGQGMGHLNGGMYPKQGNETDKPRFYIGVDDIDSHTQQFRDAGGMVLVEKQEVPGFGWAVIGSDPEGNVLGLFQPLNPPPVQAAPTRSSSSRAKRSSSSRKAKGKKKATAKKRKK
jgi:uncharacterized protein